MDNDFMTKRSFDENIVLDRDVSWPRVSIVTPSYNQVEFLERTILSVLNQNYPNLEYIIIDGGSTDGSLEIIKKYEKYLYYWESKKDKGQTDAIKKGFEKSTGDVQAWLNSDDCYRDGVLKRMMRIMLEKNADIVYGDECLVDKDDIKIGERRCLPFPPIPLGLAFFVYRGYWVYQPASFWKRELYEMVGGVDVSYDFAMDADLFIKFVLAKAKFVYEKGYAVNFRLHGTSKTCTIQEIRKKDRKRQIAEYGHKVPWLLRNNFITGRLGDLYLARHFFTGNGYYFLPELGRRWGLVKKHPLMPY